MNAKDRIASTDDSANLKRVAIENLIIGMYVSRLDRPWLDTPFAVQGFYLRTDASIQRIGKICEYVFVDPRRYDTSLVDMRHAQGRRKPEPRKASDRRQINVRPAKPYAHEETALLAEEFAPAKAAVSHAVEVIDQCLSRLDSDGTLDAGRLRGAIEPIVASVVRNKEAAAALVRMRDFDDYTYSHAISCSVWAAVLGKELGYPPADLEVLSFGCALVDLGMTKIPMELLEQVSALDESQLALLRQHVAFGLEIASEAGLRDVAVGNIIKTHHERFDGSGYPNGLMNAQIPIFGRIAGLVDSYDAMISPRPYNPAQTSYNALLELEQNGDQLFQKELVEYFISAIGIFPVGSVVELNTGEVGVVVNQNVDRRLRPKVMLILDGNKLPLPELAITDLGAQDQGQLSRTWIIHELPKDSHGIDASQYFL
jgi:HD-GYP domain-containing protein (c-di-GMP phosphodiesterase class II)